MTLKVHFASDIEPPHYIDPNRAKDWPSFRGREVTLGKMVKREDWPEEFEKEKRAVGCDCEIEYELWTTDYGSKAFACRRMLEMD